MEPEGSLPHSQMPATCPYPVPARSSPYPHKPLPEDPSEYYLPIHAWVSQVVSFPQVSPLKPCIRFTHNRCIKVWIDADNTNVMSGAHGVKIIHWNMFNCSWWSQKLFFDSVLILGSSVESNRFVNVFHFHLQVGKIFINRYRVWISGAATLIRRTAIQYILN